MPKAKKLTMNQLKDEINKLESRANFFFITTLSNLENTIIYSIPTLFQKKRKHYYGIQIRTTKYQIPLNLVYKENSSRFLKKSRKILYAIEFSWGIPEIRPWFIVNVNLEKKGKFGISRFSSTFWEKLFRKKFILPQGIKQLLQDLNTNVQIRNHIIAVLKTAETLRPNIITFVCSHKHEIIEEDRPNLSLSFEFVTDSYRKIGPENNPNIWNDVVMRSCDLLLAIRERCEIYRTLHF